MSNYYKLRSRGNVIPALVGLLMTLVMVGAVAWMSASMTAMIMKPYTTTYNDSASFSFEDEPDFTQDPDFIPVESSDAVDIVAEDSDVITEPVVEDTWIPEDTDEAYDYNVDNSAVFDSSFVEGESSEPESATITSDMVTIYSNAAESIDDERWDASLGEIQSRGEVKVVTELAPISDALDIYDQFDSAVSGVVFNKDMDTYTHFAEAFIATIENPKLSYFGMVMYVEEDTVFVLSALYGDSATDIVITEQIGTALPETALNNFSSTVADMINANTEVVQTLPPVLLSEKITPRAVFNRFDDRVTANARVYVTDWEDFYATYEPWVDSLDSVDSIGFTCCNVDNTSREFTALAYDEQGNEIAKTTYEAVLLS